MKFYEVNFDGLVGPTHNYAGLAIGNLASARNAKHRAYPKQAALQGINKMETLLKLGYRQGFIPPQDRPRLDVLRNLGFQGDDAVIIKQAAEQAPNLLAMVYSAASMWTANAATVSPSPDTRDGNLHFTPANLLTVPHRSVEATETQAILQQIFPDQGHFRIHDPLHPQAQFADEGAANHTRLCTHYGAQGVGLFTYGRDQNDYSQRFPARQHRLASEAIARAHGLKNAVFILQHPDAIDAGAFHNDVVAVGNGPVLFYHEQAFEPNSQQEAFSQLAQLLPFMPIEVPQTEVSLEDAIQTYLFNSQLLASPDGDLSTMQLIAPVECQQHPKVSRYLDQLIRDTGNPINQVHFFNLKESMNNGGGPACLRLRVVLSEEELSQVNSAFLLDEEKIQWLRAWVNRHYRETLDLADMSSIQFLTECKEALRELNEMLHS